MDQSETDTCPEIRSALIHAIRPVKQREHVDDWSKPAKISRGLQKSLEVSRKMWRRHFANEKKPSGACHTGKKVCEGRRSELKVGSG